jgi:hypothetical protein
LDPVTFPSSEAFIPTQRKVLLSKYASRWIAAGSTYHFITVCGVGLRERDHVANAGPAGIEVIAALLWKLSRECRKWRSNAGGNGKAIYPLPVIQAQMLQDCSLSHVGEFGRIVPSHFYPQAQFYKGMVTVPFNAH